MSDVIMALSTALAQVERNTEDIAALKTSLRNRTVEYSWPEFVDLKMLCQRCNLQYATMRRAEYRSQLPNEGKRDVCIAGRKLWKRNTVLEWIAHL